MATNSKIEWTDHTFNPFIGCTKVSPGCKHCYAATWANRYPRWRDTWGPGGTRIKTSDANWRKPLTWNRKAEAEGVRRKVFCGSLCDVYERKDDQPELDTWRLDLFTLIYDTPHLDWLLLTKRPEWIYTWAQSDNIWLGTSVENQEQADLRIPELLKKQATVRFLSIEPLLGPVDLNHVQYDDLVEIDVLNGTHGVYRPHMGESPVSVVDWVIVGGESGPGRRPMNLDWARSIRDQCDTAGVPFFMKQIDKVTPIPDDLMIREYPTLAPVL